MFFLDLEIPAPPLPVLLDDEGCFDDTLPPLPPPADYDTPLQSLEKGIVSTTPPPPPFPLRPPLPPSPPPTSCSVCLTAVLLCEQWWRCMIMRLLDLMICP